MRAKDAVCDAIRDVRGSKPLPPGPGRVADVSGWTASDDSNWERGFQLLLQQGQQAAAEHLPALPPTPLHDALHLQMPLFCTAYHDRLTIYRDMSGHSLHR